MTAKYFVWKYPVRDIQNPEWVELTGAEFYQLVKMENAKPHRTRFFMIVDDGIDEGMDPYVLETTQERFKEWNKEFCAKNRKRKTQNKYKKNIVSMDMIISEDSELTYHDIIADEDVSVEDRVELEMLIEDLHNVVSLLSEEEKHILDLLYFDNEDGLSERTIAEKNGMSKSSLNRQKQEILKKLRKSLGQK